MPNNAHLYAGTVYMAVYSPGGENWKTWYDTGYSEQFQVSVESESKSLESRRYENYGQAVATVNLAKPTKVTMKLRTTNQDTLAMALLGTPVTTTQTAGSVTDQAMTWEAGKIHQLQHTSLVPGTVNIGTATEADNLFVVDHALGTIAIPEDSTLTGALSYEYAAAKVNIIQGATQSSFTVAIQLVGNNLANNNQPVRVTCWKVTLSPKTAIDFLKNEHAEFEFEGSVELVPGKTGPFLVEVLAQ